MHNYQTHPVTVTLPPTFTGPNHGDFSITGGSCTSTLSADTACTLIVTFGPTALGTELAIMTVTDSPDTGSPSGYTVSFNGLASVPESLSATSLNYANVAQTASKNFEYHAD